MIYLTMLDMQPEIIDTDEPVSIACIFYTPPSSRTKEHIFYNDEAWRILSMQKNNSSQEKNLKISDISSICSDWKTTLENNFKQKTFTNSNAIYIDIVQSYRRRYTVRGVLLTTSDSPKAVKNYLFILERFTPENLNFLRIFRKFHLSHREQEIVHLLLKGDSNKEIAYSLKLSSNTIKSYMKLLMRKLGVNNRSSIIAALLTEK